MTDGLEDDGDLEIVEAVRLEYRLAQQQARLPPAEVIWLQAQLRAREEATRKAVQPVLIVQAIAVAAFAGLLASFLGRISFSHVSQIPLLLIAVVLGSWLILTPLAVYLAVSRR